jgi:hypothetical protein
MYGHPEAKSPNQVPWSTDWHRYDAPTVIRKHGREFLERLWRDSPDDLAPEQLAERLALPYGGELRRDGDTLVITFARPERAASCARRLCRTGVFETLQVELRLTPESRP